MEILLSAKITVLFLCNCYSRLRKIRHVTSTVASAVSLVRPTTTASLSHWASTFVWEAMSITQRCVVRVRLRKTCCMSCWSKQKGSIFTARCYASAVLAMGLCLSVSVCVSVSVTSRSSTKTAKRRITQTTSRDSPGSLVFWRQRYPRNSTGVTPYGGAKCRWGGSKSATFDK